MQSRYTNLNNIKLSNKGKRVYSSVIYPEISVYSGDIYIIAKETDRLDLLASTYYKDSTLWWIIAHCNKIRGTFKLPVGMQLRIPMNISQIQQDFTTLNSI